MSLIADFKVRCLITELQRTGLRAVQFIRYNETCCLSQSVLEIIWILHYVSTFEPDFNFMIDWGLACILLAVGYVGTSAIIASLMIFTE